MCDVVDRRVDAVYVTLSQVGHPVTVQGSAELVCTRRTHGGEAAGEQQGHLLVSGMLTR